MEKLFYEETQWTANFSAHPPADRAALECIIIEPRCHANLGGVLRNISCMLPNAAITVYHSQHNAAYIQDILSRNAAELDAANRELDAANRELDAANGGIKLQCFTESNITRRQYCDILCDPQFWDNVKSPKALIFQTDAGIRKNNVLRFMEYDYVGAPWSWPIYGDNHLQIGNGGFSLRTPQVMKDICANFARDPNYFDRELGEPEDIFYARHLIHMNHVNLPTVEEASAFAVEYNTHPDPFGFHQAYGLNHPPALIEHWMRNTDLNEAKDTRLKVTDAWVQSDGGRQYSTPELMQWASLGVGPIGFRMPADTLVTAMPFDIHIGYRKWLHVRFSNQKELRVPLYQNRCKTDIMVAV